MPGARRRLPSTDPNDLEASIGGTMPGFTLKIVGHALCRSFFTSRLLKFGILSMVATTTGELIGGGWRCGRGIDWDFASFSSFQTHLCGGRQKLWDADQIVCSGGEDKEPFDQVAPPVPGLSQAADRLDPAERLFDTAFA